MVTVVIVLLLIKAATPMEVTPIGILTDPTHAVFPVTSFETMVKEPLVPHAIVPSAIALAAGWDKPPVKRAASRKNEMKRFSTKSPN